MSESLDKHTSGLLPQLSGLDPTTSLAQNGDAAIRCEGLTRYYGEVKAVEDLNLRVPYGSVFGFLGRNGAGKTTTIRMLTGLAHPTRGSAWVGGIEATSADSSARRMFGYLPQALAFYNWMTPREYLDFSARLFGMSSAQTRQRMDEMLELVGLKEAAKRRIGGFSGGMIQRMGNAQAMIHNPPVLFLDEPTSALDPAGRFEVLELIAKLRGQVTVFLSSHILTDIERVCDTVAIIRSGRLELVSGKQELMERYAISAVEMEFDHSHLPIPEAFLSSLRRLSWVAGITQDQNMLRVAVSDIDQGKKILPAMIAQHAVVLNRYEWVRPTLEEIFLEVSA
jgi:ABC-2 type transport system ATP-binding protein